MSSEGARGGASLLYVDCVAGVAGDMLLAALIDAGASADSVRQGLEGLGVEGLTLRLERVERHAIGAVRAEARAEGTQPHRRFAEVRALLEQAAFPERVRARAQGVFRRLAEAEARVHRISPEQVEFHEVGAVDAIAEVCGVALALEDLAVERVVCSPLPAPRGFVRSAHGRLPLPAPATLEVLVGAPLHGVEIDAELVTPTGAALVAALAEGYGPMPAMRLGGIGYGAGSRELEAVPNVVRVMLGEPLASATEEGRVSLVETNLDDVIPELVPDAADACFAAGALDVWSAPAHMKKGRPGTVLSALVRPVGERAVAEAMMRETGSLGVRVAELRRHELERGWRTVEVEGRSVRVKVGRLGGVETSMAPEHEDCVAVAEATGASVRSVWAAALAAAESSRGEVSATSEALRA